MFLKSLWKAFKKSHFPRTVCFTRNHQPNSMHVNGKINWTQTQCTNIQATQFLSLTHSQIQKNKDTWGWGQKHTLTWTQTQTGGLPCTSGVTSRGAKPVPPVVRIKLSSFSSHQSTSVSFNAHKHTAYQHKMFSSNFVQCTKVHLRVCVCTIWTVALNLVVQHHISYFRHIVWPDKLNIKFKTAVTSKKYHMQWLQKVFAHASHCGNILLTN